MAKILILANNDVGLYKFRKELIQELLRRGNEIYISLPNGALVPPLIEMGCKFIDTKIDRRGINPITDMKLLNKYFKILSSIKPDKVITYTIKPGIYGGLICRVMKVPYFVNITGLGTALQREGYLRRIILLLYQISCKKARIVFFENEENRRFFIRNKLVAKEKTCKLTGAGVNLEEYEFCEYPENDKELRFLFIGRIMKEKGIEELFEVAKRINKEHNNVFFDIVGQVEEDYKNTFEALESQGNINLYGYQLDIKPFIKKAHCFVLPSYHEGMANTLLECGAMGRPLITSNIPGCKEAVINEVSGYLVNAKDSYDLYNKIIQFIYLPYEEKAAMGWSSRKHIEKIFDKKKVIRITVNKLGI